MKTVLVIGAGGTLSDAIGSGMEKRPPLDKGFFSQAQHTSQKLYAGVSEYCLSRYGIEVRNPENDSLETILGILYADSFSGDGSAQAAFVQLRNLVALLIKELAATTNALEPTKKDFVYLALTHLLESGVRPRDITILTYNYDIHIERLLDLIASDRGDKRLFAFPSCYQVKFTELTVPTKGKPLLFDDTSDVSDHLRLFKLHGSLNWYSQHVTRELSLKSLFNPNKSLRITRRKLIYPDMTYSSKSRLLYTFPVIVPPVINKATVVPLAMKPIWQAAEAALTEAQQVVIFGYSCPSSDTESANMFRRAYRGTGGSQRLHLIDSNPAVVLRYVDLTGVGALNYYRSAEAFVRRLLAGELAA